MHCAWASQCSKIEINNAIKDLHRSEITIILLKGKKIKFYLHSISADSYIRAYLKNRIFAPKDSTNNTNLSQILTLSALNCDVAASIKL